MVEARQDEKQDAHAALKAEAKSLMAQRDALEQQLAVATARLDASGAGLHGCLVDSEVGANFNMQRGFQHRTETPVAG